MSHLLAISIGPVQEFIAAARRTRDLWFGSFLLSEISRQVASEIEKHGGRLIFPESSQAKNVANVILAEIGGADPQTVAARAKSAAQQRWMEFAKEAWNKAREVIREDIWRDQQDDVIEFFAAWVERKKDYSADRARVMRLLAGRKNCRDFLPARGRAGVPKSSLDGRRESVLLDPKEPAWQQKHESRIRLRQGEQLDVVGLVKRISAGNRPYPSVSRVAADPWVRGNAQDLGDVVSACRALGKDTLRPLNTEVYPQFLDFPFEGSALFPNRHHELIEEAGISEEDLGNLRSALDRLPDLDPYLAVVVADGDRIGESISKLKSPDAHREFSRGLAAFADAASSIVSAHSGILVYAGGDDVLCFLPVDTCLDCARQLRDKFGDLLKDFGSPTFSVGIAIAHYLEHLEDLLEYGRTAEKDAKQPDRDGLAVHVRKRGGVPIEVRRRWDAEPDAQILKWAHLINMEAIPRKLPYDLRNMARLYQGWPKESCKAALQQDVIRVVRDKRPPSGREHLQEMEDRIAVLITDSESLNSFTAELLVAQQVAVGVRQAGQQQELSAEVAP